MTYRSLFANLLTTLPFLWYIIHEVIVMAAEHMNDSQKREVDKFQRNLSMIRRISGLTAEELGTRIGVSKQMISTLEKDSSNYRMTKQQYIALRAVLENEADRQETEQDGSILRQVMTILLNDNSSESESRENEERVQTVAAAKNGGASGSSVRKILSILYPSLTAVGSIVAGAWLTTFLNKGKH